MRNDIARNGTSRIGTVRQQALLATAIAVAGLLPMAANWRLAADDPAQPAKSVADEPDPAPGDHDRWMRLKVISSQRIFDALTSGDFKAVEQNARRMQVLNLLEQWLKRREFAKRSEYIGQLNAFEFAVKELIRHGNDQDMDGALEAYVALSRSCVRCHQLLRDSAAE